MKRMFDKEEIVEIAKEEGGSITVDSELSSTSENPVQNKVITEALKRFKDIYLVNFKISNAAITVEDVTIVPINTNFTLLIGTNEEISSSRYTTVAYWKEMIYKMGFTSSNSYLPTLHGVAKATFGEVDGIVCDISLIGVAESTNNNSIRIGAFGPINGTLKYVSATASSPTIDITYKKLN